jgi:hypothetical protein
MEELPMDYSYQEEKPVPIDLELVAKENAIKEKVANMDYEFNQRQIEDAYRTETNERSAKIGLTSKLCDLLCQLQEDNLNRDRLANRLTNVLHVERMQNSADEALTLNEILGYNPNRFEDAGNYFPSPPIKEGIDVAYYFPLRNEKNSSFLVAHQTALEHEVENLEIELGLAKNKFEEFDHKAKQILKDVHIFRIRVIDISRLVYQADRSSQKNNYLEHLRRNLETNVKCKMTMVAKLNGRREDDYDGIANKLTKEKEERVISGYVESLPRPNAERNS